MEDNKIEAVNSVNELHEQRVQELKDISKKIKDIIFDYSFSANDKEKLEFLKQREKELQGLVNSKPVVLNIDFGGK